MGTDVSSLLLNNLLGLLSNQIIVPGDYHSRVQAVKSIYEDDATGLIDTLTDFQVNTFAVDLEVYTDSDELTRILRKWLDRINLPYEGKIPPGLKPLQKEYGKERWKYSSFPVLKINGWEEIDGIELPTKMFFLDGGSIYAQEKEKDMIRVDSYDYYLGRKMAPQFKLGKDVIFDRPFGRIYEKYPIPYLIRRGIYRNYKLIKSIKNKEAKILDQIIPYLLLIKKGTERLAIDKEVSYSSDELKEIVAEFQSLVDQIKHSDTTSLSKTKSPVRATQYDESLEHLIPNLENMFSPALFTSAEKHILSGLNFIDVVEGSTNSRKESVLSPKPFIEETKNGIEDFKRILRQVIWKIQQRNVRNHRKWMNTEIKLVNNKISAFVTDEMKNQVRLAWKGGALSNRTYTEIVPEVDYDIEKEFRAKELIDGDEMLMYPHLTDNREQHEPIDETNRVDKEDDKKGKPLPPDKTEPEQKEEYDIGKIVKCPNCGNEFDYLSVKESGMGWVKCPKCKAAVTQKNLEGAPYSNIKELPQSVKDKMSKALQRVFLKVWNNAYKQYKDEAKAFATAWKMIKKKGKLNKNRKWVMKNSIHSAQSIIDKYIEKSETQEE